MNTFAELYSKTIKRLEQKDARFNVAGNRPHYPMLVFSNLADRQALLAIRERINKMWPQIGNNIIFARQTEQDSFSLMQPDPDKQLSVSVNEFRERLDQIKRNYTIFDDVTYWLLFHIIDTSSCSSLDDFKTTFTSLTGYQQAIVDECKTLAVIILDESVKARALSKQIRQYLSGAESNRQMYDGVLLISTLSYTGIPFQVSDLLPIVGEVLIASNNDAIGSYDDEVFRKIQTILFSKKMNTVSHAYKLKPNRKITLQMYDTFLAAIDKRITELTGKSQELQKVFNLYAGQIKNVDASLNNCEISLDVNSVIKNMPVRTPDFFLSKPDKVKQDKYLNQIIPEELELLFTQEIDGSQQTASIIETATHSYRKHLRSAITAPELAGIPASEIDKLFKNNQNTFVAAKNFSLGQYLRELYLFCLKQSKIYPAIHGLVLSYLDRSVKALSSFRDILNAYRQMRPIDGYSELGNMYWTIADTYLKTDAAEQHIRMILSIESNKEAILDELYHMAEELIEKNKGIFELTFIEEWEKRLGDGETVYTKLNPEIEEMLNKRVFLKGNYNMQNATFIYLFHSHNSSDQPTELMRHFYENPVGIAKGDDIYFLNTGDDDSISVLKLIDITSESLDY